MPEMVNPGFGDDKGGTESETTGEAARSNLLRSPERQEVLRALDWFAQAAEKLLEIGVAFDEIDFRGVDDQLIRGRVTEEEMIVGPDNFFEVGARDLFFRRGFFPMCLSQVQKSKISLSIRLFGR